MSRLHAPLALPEFTPPFLAAGKAGWLWLVLLLAALGGCEKKQEEAEPPPAPPPPPAAVADDALINATLAAWQQASHDLSRAQTSAGKLCGAIEGLLATPDEPNLAATRSSWHRAHNDYNRLRPYLALAQSSPGLFGQLREIDSLLDAWPIQPGYLDYFDVYSHSGIVNDIAVPVTADALRQQHGFSDATDVSLGFHAMAYLLWGENGQRPATDFAAASELEDAQRTAGLSIVDLPTNRRRTLLTLMCNLLTDDLVWLNRVWNQASGDLPRGYQGLMPHSRVKLLQAAALQYVSGNLLAEQIEPLLNSRDPEMNTDNEALAWSDAEALHNRFAGRNAEVMAAGLDGLERLLFKPETRLANWMLEENDRTRLQQHLDQAQELLKASPDPWKEPGAQMQALRAELDEIVKLLFEEEPSLAGKAFEPQMDTDKHK